jgi:hypothetical protein
LRLDQYDTPAAAKIIEPPGAFCAAFFDQQMAQFFGGQFFY